MITLGIAFGGKSLEHDISIITAYQLKKKLESEYNIKMIYFDINGKIHDSSKMSFNDFKVRNYRFKRLKTKGIDVIVGAFHGENGEDGLGYAFARLNNIKYLGCGLFGSSLGIDKYLSYLYLANNGINMLDTIVYSYEDYLNEVEIPFMPFIIKPLYGGSSIGIEVCKSKKDIITILSKAFKDTKKVVIQPYVENIEEYNLALNEVFFSRLEKINKKDGFFSFDNKYKDSFKLMHQDIVNNTLYLDFCKIARKVYQLIDASGIIRIDFFFYNNQIYVNEINTTPGALSIYLFDDFLSVFNKSLEFVLLEKEKEYVCGNFLEKNNINK